MQISNSVISLVCSFLFVLSFINSSLFTFPQRKHFLIPVPSDVQLENCVSLHMYPSVKWIYSCAMQADHYLQGGS